jgi:hypothetical protein
VQNSFHEEDFNQFFGFCSAILNTQDSFKGRINEGTVLFDEECIEMFFFDLLLSIDFSSINKVVYDCYQAFFIHINIQFGQIIKS